LAFTNCPVRSDSRQGIPNDSIRPTTELSRKDPCFSPTTLGWTCKACSRDAHLSLDELRDALQQISSAGVTARTEGMVAASRRGVNGKQVPFCGVGVKN